jgi:hypothetical protein
MKQVLVFFAALSLLSSCKEQTPAGLNLNDNTIAKDTTYLASPETPQVKGVLIEESTGNKCSNCPAGKAQIDQMSKDNPGRIYTVALHYKGLEFHEPANKYYSLETQDTRDLIGFLDGDQGQPCASFNRVPVSGKYFLIRGTGGNWSSALNAELAKSTPVNLTVSSDYKAADNKATITTTVAFTENVTGKLHLSLFLLEDGLLGTQDSITPGLQVIKIENFEFNHVFRKAITPVIGTSFLDSLTVKQQGRVFKKTVIFEPDASWDKSKCSIIALVHRADAADKSVLQVAKAYLNK